MRAIEWRSCIFGCMGSLRMLMALYGRIYH
jgi:hypothetical protein